MTPVASVVVVRVCSPALTVQRETDDDAQAEEIDQVATARCPTPAARLVRSYEADLEPCLAAAPAEDPEVA